MTTTWETADRATMTELFAGIGTGVRDLAEAHADQLCQEVTAETARAHSAVGLLITGSVGIGVGLVFVLETLVAYLYEIRGWTIWSACLTVASVAIAGGIPIWLWGHSRLQSVNVIPRNTLTSVRESLSCIANTRT